MKDCIIYYFSATGNTKLVCEKLAKQLEQRDMSVTLWAIEKTNPPSPLDYDCVGIAYPVHGFNAPEPIDKFAKTLPPTNDKYLFVIKTGGEPLHINDASSRHFLKILSKKGYLFAGEYHYIMPYNIIFRHSDDMVALMRNALEKRLPIDADHIARGEIIKKKIPLRARATAAIVRIEHPAMHIIGRGFKVNYDKCLYCNKCVNRCPQQNIEIKNKKFEFKSYCIGCMRCAFDCPADAIKTGLLNPWRVNGKYDFEGATLSEKPEIIRYCHKSYVKYFFDES